MQTVCEVCGWKLWGFLWNYFLFSLMVQILSLPLDKYLIMGSFVSTCGKNENCIFTMPARTFLTLQAKVSSLLFQNKLPTCFLVVEYLGFFMMPLFKGTSPKSLRQTVKEQDTGPIPLLSDIVHIGICQHSVGENCWEVVILEFTLKTSPIHIIYMTLCLGWQSNLAIKVYHACTWFDPLASDSMLFSDIRPSWKHTGVKCISDAV